MPTEAATAGLAAAFPPVSSRRCGVCDRVPTPQRPTLPIVPIAEQIVSTKAYCISYKAASWFCHYSRYRDYAVGFSRLDDGSAAVLLMRSIVLDAAWSWDVRVVWQALTPIGKRAPGRTSNLGSPL